MFELMNHQLQGLTGDGCEGKGQEELGFTILSWGLFPTIWGLDPHITPELKYVMEAGCTINVKGCGRGFTEEYQLRKWTKMLQVNGPILPLYRQHMS